MACLYALLCEASSDSFAIYNTKYHKQKRTNCSRKSWDFTLGIYTVLCHRWRIMIRIQVIVLKKSRRFTKLRGSSGRSSGERKTALVFYENGQGLWIQVVSPLVASVTGWLQLSLLWERTEKIKNGEIRSTSIITEVSNHWDKDILQNEFQAVIWCRFWEKIHHRQPTRITLVFFSYHWIMGIAMFLGCLCGKNARTPSALSPILPGLPHHTRPALEGINFIAVMFSGIPERPEIWQLL